MEQGFSIEKQYISLQTVQTLKNDISNFTQHMSPHGIRNADKKFSNIAELAASYKIINIAKQILGPQQSLYKTESYDCVHF